MTDLTLVRTALTDMIDLGTDAATALATIPTDTDPETPGAPGAVYLTPGLYVTRPAAATHPGAVYVALDVQEMYLSTGSAWVVIGSGGNELGRARLITGNPWPQVAPSDPASPAPVAVPGMSVTFVAGERPVIARVTADTTNTGAGGVTGLYLALDGAVVARPERVHAVAGKWDTLSAEYDLPTLAPGSTHTVALHMWSSIGTGGISGTANNAGSLTVTTR